MEIQFNGKQHAFKPTMSALSRVEARLKKHGKDGGILSLVPTKGGEFNEQVFMHQLTVSQWADFVCAALDIDTESICESEVNLNEVLTAAANIIASFLSPSGVGKDRKK